MRYRTSKVLSLILVMTCGSAMAADSLPPGENDAKQRLEKSPRHGEYVNIAAAGRDKPLSAYVVYPEAKEKAPVVIIIHEIYGLSDWIKSVADQAAADGFIAIAPDMLSGMGEGGKGTDGLGGRDAVTKAVRELSAERVIADLNAVREHGQKIASSNGKTATIGFCWGGGQSFAYAVAQPALNAAVVYYGTNPPAEQAKAVKVPVLGNYGSDDARVNSTIPAASEAIKSAGGKYEAKMYEGAGHGFLRQQDARDGANMKATKEAWPVTVKFVREHTK